MAKKRHDCKKVPMDAIRILPDTLVRQSLVRKLQGGDTEAVKSECSELVDSMKAKGQIEAIGVAKFDLPAEVEEAEGPVYQLVFGLRRFLAAQILGWDEILCTIL